MKIKKYDINSFERLCNVINEKNFNVFTLDLITWLSVYVRTINKIRAKYPEETKNKSNTEISAGSFVWYDDNKNDWKGITLINKETGEITTIK